MKILHVITTLETGGAEKLMVDLLPRLKEIGNDVELAVLSGQMTSFMQSLIDKGIKVHRLSETPVNVYSIKNLFRLRRLIKNGKYDIIHTHNTAAQLFGAMVCAKGSARVTTEHNTTNRRRDHRWLKPIDRWMYGRYQKIACISNAALDNLNQYLGYKDKNILIANGINLNLFKNDIKNISDNKDFVITMVSAFRRQKDQDTLVRAMTLLPSNYRLRLAGDGERRNCVENLVSELDLTSRVEFLGVRSDIPDLLKQSDINVLSSHYEGLSLSSVECMASGRPFIASDVPGLHEVVYGAGILFPEGDAQELASIIINLTSDTNYYMKIAHDCQERANNYDITNTAYKYIELYSSIYGTHY